MKILVFGKSGQVATALQQRADVTALGRADADLTNSAACAAAIAAHAPDVVINAAAYTAVDKAEEEEAIALTVNGDAPTAMAQACASAGIPFVHISTDYVFDGSGDAPWPTDAPTGPLGAYGRTKLAGEDGIRAAGGTFAILRTAWVFSETGNNFVKTMLRLAETRDALNVVNDQFGGPTDADAIAAACLEIAAQLHADASKSGTYHFAGMPHVSWADFANAIFDTASKTVAVSGIPASEYPTPAVRPSNSRLDCDALTATFGIPAPKWQDGLTRVIKSLQAS
ncbi:dTDP-4-dehydrorhamnose reductase [Planktotalea sp.]|uniref:dTDP-4-dehydrorhamnose reductase n=1 Tax=Planktotalea sp. TaxID=2029877 RepID=UPI00329A5199